MATLREHYARFDEEWAEVDKRNQKRMIFEKAASIDDDTAARLMILGGIMTNFIPQVESLQRKQSESESDIEFAPVVNFFSMLFDNEGFVNWLIGESFGAVSQAEVK